MSPILRVLFLSLLYGFAIQANAACTKLSTTCVDTTASKNISGVMVTLADVGGCWKYEDQYRCDSGAPVVVNDCQPLVDKGCGLVGSSCIDYLDDGVTCSLYERTYQCKTADGGTSTVMDCGGQTYCMDGNCTDVSYAPDTDFGKTIVSMEVLREAGVYLDEGTMTLFKGKNNKCTVTLGIFNCCRTNTKGANMSNSSMTSKLVTKGLMSVGSETVQYLGSTYMYDALFQSDAPNFLISGWESIYGSGSSSAFNPSISYYGLSMSFGAPTAAMKWSYDLGAGLYVGFDPVSFGISIAIYIITELISCDQDEQILAMKRGQKLCAKVGSYCSSEVAGACLQKKESYCCYNSRLARIIAVEGRKQLAKSWGRAKKPDCGGFTQAEIAAIDFSLIDFTAVVAEVSANIKTPNFAIERATTKINNYYSTP